MKIGELPTGFRWTDLQPAIKPACEKVVRSDTFHDLVDILRKHPDVKKVEMNIPIDGVEYNSGLYRCVIGNTSSDYFILIQPLSPDLRTSSTGEMDK